MSGTQPYRSEDEHSAEADDASRSLYGAPRATPRPGEETTETADDAPAPLGMVAPPSIEEDGPDEATVHLRDDEPAAPRTPLKLAGEDEPAPARPAAPRSPAPAPAAAADGGESLGLGNRPAQGARVVSASEMFREGFLGQEGASDFLGLDTEFDPTPVAAGASSGPSLDEAPSFAPVATEEEPGAYASPLSPPRPDEDFAPAAEEDEYAYAYAEDDVAGFDEELAGEDAAPRRSRRPLIAGLALVGAAAAAAAFLAPGLLGGKEEPAPVEVAARPTTDAPRPSRTAPAASETPEPRPVEEFVPSPDGGPGGPSEIAAAEPPPLSVETAPEASEPPPAEVAASEPPSDPTEAAQAAEPSVPSAEETLTLERIRELAGADAFLGQNPSMLDLVWRGEVVALDAIAAPSRILTPAVGNVRVTMDTADAFEGRLFAVGENKVWLDLQLGRIGLDGTAVVSIERLVGEADPNVIVDDPAMPGDYVRAQVPGGVIYGRVKAQRGSLVTLVTESGARITLDDPVLKPTGNGKLVAIKN